MATWRRPVRMALLLVVLGVVAAVVSGLRQRASPVQGTAVARLDPDAVIETRGSRLLQTDATGENLRVDSDRQATYSDGRVRLFGGVVATVAERVERDGFALTGEEAILDADQTGIELKGGVRMTTKDGLRAETEAASYSDDDGIVSMPVPTAFHQDGLDAAGETAAYDRRRNRLRLHSNSAAQPSSLVDLVDGASHTRFRSVSATLAPTESFMQFDGNVTVEKDSYRMAAAEVRIELVDEGRAIRHLELQGQAEIRTETPTPGGLQGLGSDSVRLDYSPGEQARHLERATLSGSAQAAVYSADSTPGSDIRGQSMTLAFTGGGALTELEALNQVTLRMPDPEAPDSGAGSTIEAQSVQLAFAYDGALQDVVAREQVAFRLPATASGTTRAVRAGTLAVTPGGPNKRDAAVFDGAVTYTEQSDREAGGSGTRRTSAERMEAVLTPGLAALETALFSGSVRFDDGERVGEADAARYDVAEGTVTLLTTELSDVVPRVVDQRGSVTAAEVTLHVDGGQMEAVGGVRSVLEPHTGGAHDAGRRPALLEALEAVSVVADQLFYDRTTSVATYAGSARLWQSGAVFAGDEIVLDEAHGNFRVTGAVRTQTSVRQLNAETGLHEDETTSGAAAEFAYDEAEHRVAYAGAARVAGPSMDLRADSIVLALEMDGSTLVRIEAAGTVDLKLPGRQVTGESLVYRDADGRYEIEGAPVHMIEQITDGCRETTGRRLTFFATAGEVSVDGAFDVRTETAAATCPAMDF